MREVSASTDVISYRLGMPVMGVPRLRCDWRTGAWFPSAARSETRWVSDAEG